MVDPSIAAESRAALSDHMLGRNSSKSSSAAGPAAAAAGAARAEPRGAQQAAGEGLQRCSGSPGVSAATRRGHTRGEHCRAKPCWFMPGG